MPLTFDEACKIVLMERKLHDLRAAAKPADYPDIDAQLARLDQYEPGAENLVMQHTDAEFTAAANALKQQTKPIDDAIADISKISAAITTAAQIISNIVQVVGAIPKI